MSSSASIQVLLGTFNGERFLCEQIDSILSQTYSEVSVLARDDGSTDDTPAILVDYAKRFPNRFTVMPTDSPTGSPKGNFARLLESSHGPYLAFADQDDVWIPEKLTLSMQAMRGMEERKAADVPRLVFTDLAVVDQELASVQPSFWRHQNINPDNIHQFRRLLTQNVATGCTMLFNRSLAELAFFMPDQAFMHDWWLALLASAFGQAAVVPTPTVLYRQHDRNVVGAADHVRVTGLPRWRHHDKRRAQWEMTARQAAALLDKFHDRLHPHNRKLLDAYVRCETSPSAWYRVFTLIRHRFFLKGLRPNLAILLYLWDMEAAKKNA